jgi:tRNA A-37 threonylcarbamoyl transferase component Bud32
MFENILVLLKIIFILSYSYITNVLIYNDVKLHTLYCIEKISKVNMFFIKLLQWIVNEDNNEEIKNICKNFGNNVYYHESEKRLDNLLLVKEYLHNKNINISINENPINSGTIALVFDGYYDGKHVIIKQLRPNIREKLIKSIELMLFIGYIFSYFQSSQSLQIYEIIKNNKDNLLTQLDFKQEVNNILEFSEKNKNNEKINIPYVYSYITDKFNDIIVMEYIEGKNIYDLNLEESNSYIKPYNQLLMYSLLENQIFHADLHSGNIIFMKNKKIGVIDFGYVIRFEKQTSKKLFIFYKLIYNRQLKKLAKFVIEDLCEDISSNNNSHEIERKTLYEEMHIVFSSRTAFNGKRPIELNDFVFVNNILKKINKKVSKEFMNLALALGPCCSLVSIIKKSEFENSFKLLFFDYIRDNIPKNLKDYDEKNANEIKKIKIKFN